MAAAMAAVRFPYVRRLVDFGHQMRAPGSSSSAKEFYDMTEDLGYVLTTWEWSHLLVVDAEEIDVRKETVKNWLREGKKLAYEGEDVLDACEYELLHAMAKETEQARGRMPRSGVVLPPTVDVDQVSIFTTSLLAIPIFQDDVPRMARIFRDSISKITELREAIKLKDSYGEKPFSETPPSQLSTGSLPSDTFLLGRDDDLKRLVKLLQSDDVGEQLPVLKNIHVVAVVGMGGIGKTTLVQNMFKGRDVSRRFDLKGWVCVSSTEPDVVKLTNATSESFTEKDSPNFTQLAPSQDKLLKVVEGKKFLLVLDDIWDDSPDLWERFFTPLGYGAEGSKVVITTRNKEVAHAMGVMEPYMLGCLSVEDSRKLFEQCVFGSGRLSDIEHVGLQETGEKIVKKCDGLPLAVKVIGRLLWRHKKDEKKWREVLNSDTWNVDVGKNEIHGSLCLSYFHLPWYLKPCFKFCAMFPKNRQINKEQLIRLWMANNFVHPVEGMGYIDEFLSRSLLQPAFIGKRVSSSVVTVHDLVHDLAHHMSGGECQFVWPDMSPSIAIRHMLVQSDNPSPSWHSSSNLRTLVLEGLGVSLQKVETCKNLRATIISNGLNETLGDYLCNLRHLRFLQVEKLPCTKTFLESVCVLYHLQTLHLSDCNINELPDSMGNLKQLRELSIPQNAVEELPESICELCNLQILDLNHTRIKQLPDSIGSLKQLRQLRVFDSRVEKLPQSLCKLHDLQILHVSNLYWIPRVDSLEDLFIEDCPKLNSLPSFSHLQFLEIKNCSQLHSIPTLSSLKRLFIDNCPKLNSLPTFSHLQFLEFKNCSQLHSISTLSSLEDLVIYDCPKLNSLPTLSRLRNLRIKNCSQFHSIPTLSSLEVLFIDDCPQLNSLPTLSHLQKLEIKNCSQLHSIPTLSSLENLTIDDCPKLNSLPTLSSLEDLVIYTCPKLNSLPTLSRLRNLRIKNCSQLHSIPTLSSLKDLTIDICPKLNSLPTLSSLLDLDIWNCHKLNSLSTLSCLRNLRINNCSQLYSIPTLSSLKDLFIDKCPKLNSLPTLSSLEDLVILTCPKLNSLPTLSRLRNLDISRCSQLHSISTLSSLEDLDIYLCPLLNSLPTLSHLRHLTIHSCSQLHSIPTLSSLEDLCIFDCPQLNSLPTLSHLQNLEIRDCSQLHSISTLSSLKLLVIHGCPQVNSLPTLCATLESLSLYKCRTLSCIGLTNFTSLERLRIKDCPQLTSLPSIPSLKRLIVEDCESLTSIHLSRFSTVLREIAVRSCGKLGSIECFQQHQEEQQELVGSSSSCFLEEIHHNNDGEECAAAASYSLSPSVGTLLPSSLQRLVVVECPLLLEWCQSHKDAKLEEILRVDLDSFRNLRELEDGDYLNTILAMDWEGSETESEDGDWPPIVSLELGTVANSSGPLASLERPDRIQTPVSMAGLTAMDNRTADIMPRISDDSDKIKIWKLADIVDSAQLKALRLPDATTAGKVVRLLYTNSGLAVLALSSNAVHKLWKWQRNERNLSGKSTASVVPQLWQPSNGIPMTNDTSDSNLADESIACIALSKNDCYVMSASGGKVSLFNMMTFKVMTTFMAPPPAATFLAFHPQDNNIIAIGMEDSTIQIYNVRIDEVKTKLKGHQKKITGLAFSQSMNVLVSSGADAQLCLWSIDGWEKKKARFIQPPASRSAPLVGDTKVQFHNDQTHLLVVHESQLAIYDSKLDCLRSWSPRDLLAAPISSAIYSCDGLLVYAGFCDGAVGIFDSDGLRLRCRIGPTAYISPVPSSGMMYPMVIAAHPTKPNQIALGMTDGAVHVVEPLRSMVPSPPSPQINH